MQSAPLIITIANILFFVVLLFFFCRLSKKLIHIKNANSQLEADIIKARLMSEETERMYKAQNVYLGRMSHEIRTPMNAILGYGRLLRSTMVDLRQKEYLDNITSSANMLLNIMEDFLDNAKCESGELNIENVDFSLTYLCHDIVQSLDPKINSRGIDFHLVIGDDVPLFLKGAPTRLRKVLINLLSNSIKFTTGRSVELKIMLDDTVKIDGKYVLRFVIFDSGECIPEDKIDTIFKPFVKLKDEPGGSNSAGVGVGLSLCRSIVAAMGGKIWASARRGIGNEFIFYLPFELGEKKVANNNVPLRMDELKKMSIFIISDDESAQRVFKQLCSDAGVKKFEICNKIQTAHDKITYMSHNNFMPDLIIYNFDDVVTEGKSFVDFVRNGLGQKEAKIAAVVARAYPGIAEELSGSGFDAYLNYPFKSMDFYSIVTMLLGTERSNGEILNRHEAGEVIRGNDMSTVLLLVAEDNKTNQALIKVYCDTIGCTVDFVDNGRELVDLLREKKDAIKYNLCLVDIQMPVMGGLEAVEIIRSDISSELPIYALTAAALDEDRQRALQVGCDGFLTKPISMELFTETVMKFRKS